jgi:hypothetical protein
VLAMTEYFIGFELVVVFKDDFIDKPGCGVLYSVGVKKLENRKTCVFLFSYL